MKYSQTNRHTYYFFVLAAACWMLDAPGACFAYSCWRRLHVVGFVLFIVAPAFHWHAAIFLHFCFVSFRVQGPTEDLRPRWMACLANNLAVSFNALQLLMMGHLSGKHTQKCHGHNTTNLPSSLSDSILCALQQNGNLGKNTHSFFFYNFYVNTTLLQEGYKYLKIILLTKRLWF